MSNQLMSPAVGEVPTRRAREERRLVGCEELSKVVSVEDMYYTQMPKSSGTCEKCVSADGGAACIPSVETTNNSQNSSPQRECHGMLSHFVES